MAIRRCPYCKAIIDEGSEYCSNCGTQLIFPEDEFVEEEIPGEKIIDVNEGEENPQDKNDLVKGRSRATKGKRGKIKAEEVSEEEKDDVAETDSETAQDEISEPEVKAEAEQEPELDAEIEQQTEPETELKPDPEGKLDDEEITQKEKEELPAYMQEETPVETPSEEGLEPREDLAQKVEYDAEEGVEEEKSPDESADFRTADLEGMVDPAEKEKEEIEKFLNSLKEEREKTKKYYEETGELPPWAQSMREGTTAEATFDEDEEIGEAPIEHEESLKVEDGKDLPDFEESFEEERVEEPIDEESVEPDKEFLFEEEKAIEEEAVRGADTGMGLPEGLDQQNLPFGQGLFESTSPREKKRRLKKPDIQFSPWVKSRVFDVLIIVGVWLVAIWLASRVVGIGFFQMLTTATVQTLVFLLILLVIYFFLFLFFLGETLGDHLFSEES
ncbi:MAG: hypothetical protein PVH84_13165 [Candidatus Aminicenantes bacterium]|jgi:hypothetical protein